MEAGGSGSRGALGFTNLLLGINLVKAGLGVHLGLSRAHPDPAEAAPNCGSLVVPINLPGASHRQNMTLATTRVLPKRFRTNTPSG